jgi:hypothetical protein
MKKLLLVSVIALGFTACGSGSNVAATAAKGDAFCKLAQTAKTANDQLDALDFTDTAKVRIDLPSAIDSLSAATAKAPKDIAATFKDLLTKEEQIETVLKANDFDIVKTQATSDGKKAIDDLQNSPVPDQVDAYLSDKCGIATDHTTPDTTPSDSTPVDTTPADSTPVDTAPTDSVAVGDTSVDTIVDLGEGEVAINKFLDFYELGTSSKLTADQRSCIVAALVDTVTGSELNQAIAGQASPELQQALGLAFINCKVTIQS